MPRFLIVAYGNPLRSDDGVAWRAAEALAAKYSEPDVEIVTVHQLGPEIADSISRAECVIFIDAATRAAAAGEVQIKEMTASAFSEPPGFCHALSPSHVLTLAAHLYRAQPRAFSVTVAGENFDHGESLSAPVRAALPELIARIDDLLAEAGLDDRR